MSRVEEVTSLTAGDNIIVSSSGKRLTLHTRADKALLTMRQR